MIAITDSDFHLLVAGVWDMQLGLTVEPVDPPLTPDASGHITGRIRISGAWEGTVQLICPRRLAMRAAEIMFGLRENDVTPEHKTDTVAELTNIIGGNIKALLAQPAFLDTPVVVTGAEPLPKGPDCLRSSFRMENLTFSVEVSGAESDRPVEVPAEETPWEACVTR